MNDLNKRLAGLSPAQRELLLKKLRSKGKTTKIERIGRRNDRTSFPISSAQSRLWFLQQLELNSPFYNIPSAIQISGKLNYTSVQQSIQRIIKRHEVLRAYFEINAKGEPVQKISASSNIEIPVTDLSDVPEKRQEKHIQNLLKSEAAKPFDLSRPPLLRIRLIKLSPIQHILSLNMHHIVADGWSIGIFIGEFKHHYEYETLGKKETLPDLEIQYADYASWQNAKLEQQQNKQQLQFWIDYLQGMPDVLDLPTDYPKPASQTFHGKQLLFNLDEQTTNGLRDLAKKNEVTLYVFLLAAFQIFLAKISSQYDFGIGIPIANRNRSEIESLIGYFVNTVVLRANLDANPGFQELTQKIKQDIINASDNQDVPFEQIVEAVSDGPQLEHSPLFQIMFDLQRAPFDKLSFAELTIGIKDIEIEVAKFNLMLLMLEYEQGIRCTFEYNTDLFSDQTIMRFQSYFRTLLQEILRQPDAPISELTLILPEEKHKILHQWNQTSRPYPADKSTCTLFQEQVKANPDQLAVKYEQTELSYAQLDKKSNQLAQLLVQQGVSRGDFVALYMDRSVNLLVSVMAILKAGAVYVPIDPVYPVDRVTFMLEDSQAKIVLTQGTLMKNIAATKSEPVILDDPHFTLDSYPATTPEVRIGPLDAAYMIYTSGSTGNPKGVIVPHRAIIRLVVNTNYLQVLPGQVVAQVANISFDAATFEIWAAFLNGAALIGIPKEVLLAPEPLQLFLEKHHIDHMVLTTAVFNQIVLERPKTFASVKNLMYGGEQANAKAVQMVLENNPPENLINVYGPTENTTYSTTYCAKQIPGNMYNVPIGPPVANSTCYVLDKFNKPVPIGVPGELFVGGDGLALGYHNRPELTSERFVANPLNIESDPILYRTGDLVRYLADGNLEFLARLDEQVKIRGFRIELGEIAENLKNYPKISDAVVRALLLNGSEKTLVAYYVTDQSEELRIQELRLFLLEKLPEYMVPVNFIKLDKIPITANGKTDYKALPAPALARPDLEIEYIAPRNELENFLASIWYEILQVDKIGIKDNFFDLGGNSLKAAVFANRIQKEFGLLIHVSMIFKAPTIAELAAYIVNYFPQIAFDHFNLDPAVESIYKLINEPEKIERRIEEPQIERLRGIISPLPARKIKTKQKNPSAVFVLSPPRSGSTLLRVMLAGNKKLFSPPELDLLSFNTLQERRKAFSHNGLEIWLEATIRAIIELEQTDVDSAKKIMADYVEQNLSVKDFYLQLQNSLGERILVDKTPTYAFDPNILQRAEEDFDSPKYIHLIRHPYAMIYSFIEAKLDKNFFRYPHNFSRRELGELIYVICHQNINSFLSQVPNDRHIRMKFEDLVNDPYQAVSKISKFLNIEFDPEMLKPYQGNKMTDGISSHSQMVGDFKFYLRKNIDTSVIDQWRNHHQQDFLGDPAWALAEGFGYPVEKELAVTSNHTFPQTIGQIKPVPRDQELPLSFAQQRLWFLDQMDPGDPQYNIPGAIRIKGPLDITALDKTLNIIIDQHETLRTFFSRSAEGKASQIILPNLALKMSRAKLTKPSEQQLQEAINLEARRPFNLSTGPLIRAHLIDLGQQEYIFITVMHHIISDGWSVNIFIKQLAEIYNALVAKKPVTSEKPMIQYVDFAAWQREWMNGETIKKQLSYWEKQLAGISPLIELPTDFKRPAVQSHSGKRLVFHFQSSLFQKLKQLGNAKETTLFMTMLAAFEALLYRYSGQEDFTIGTPVANRVHSDIEPLIGFFVNTLVLRCTVSGDRSFSHLLRQVKRTAMEAYDHQDIPFEKLVDYLEPERNMNLTPLFQVMFSMQRSDVQEFSLSDLEFKAIEMESGTAKFDLNLEIVEHSDRLVAIIEYKTALFRETTIKRMLNHFNSLLEAIVLHPDQNIFELPLLQDAEKDQILSRGLAAPLLYPEDKCLHQLIEDQAARQADQFAVGIWDDRLNFEELNQKANQLAHYLLNDKIKPGNIIGILMERSTDMIVSMLAVWKAGCAYLPLDPSYPQERLAFMIQDAQLPLIISHQSLISQIDTGKATVLSLDRQQTNIKALNKDNPNLAFSSEELAYIIYTSGSTGKPKGVMISHKSAVHLAANLNHTIYAPMGEQKLRISLNAPVSFDASVQQIVMLTYGHGLQIIPIEVRADGSALVDYIRKYNIQVIDCVPSQLKLMLSSGLLAENKFKPLAVLPGGEAIDEKTWQILVSSDKTRFFNVYGPTECTVDSTICDVASSPETPVIGKPIHNVQFYILDQNEELVPDGVPGELHICGPGLARGYLNRPSLTSEKFIANPFENQDSLRLYKTGDLVRQLADGNIEFLGRVDNQVKIRGFRMELGEIESRLREFPEVQDVVVVASTIKEGDKRLVAYLISQSNDKINISHLRDHLKNSLPDYMLPALFMPVDNFPLLPNGKINLKALPQPVFDRDQLQVELIAPANEKEKLLVSIWKTVLGVEQLGTKDNFFELGGDSILSIQVVARANQAGLKISPRQIFENPTIQALARAAEKVIIVQAEQGIISGTFSLSAIQREFFELQQDQPWHWNQSLVLETETDLDASLLEKVLLKMVEHHDALRMRFSEPVENGQGTIAETENASLLEIIDLSDFEEADQDKMIPEKISQLQASLNLEKGPILRCALIRRGTGHQDLIILIIHHLAVDGLSWRILSEDMQTIYKQLLSKTDVALPRKTTSFKEWTEKISAFSRQGHLDNEIGFWQKIAQLKIPGLPKESDITENIESDIRTVSADFDPAFTSILLRDVHTVYNTQINDILLTALVTAIKRWTGQGRIVVAMEGHGREDVLEDVSLARTVGWFTSKYPVYLDLSTTIDPGQSVLAIKEQLRSIPNNGLGFGLIKYFAVEKEEHALLKQMAEPEIVFNNLGQFRTAENDQGLFKPIDTYNFSERSPRAKRSQAIDINISIKSEALHINFSYNSQMFKSETMQNFLDSYLTEIKNLVEYLNTTSTVGYSPSDFIDADLDSDALGDLLSELDEE